MQCHTQVTHNSSIAATRFQTLTCQCRDIQTTGVIKDMDIATIFLTALITWLIETSANATLRLITKLLQRQSQNSDNQNENDKEDNV